MCLAFAKIKLSFISRYIHHLHFILTHSQDRSERHIIAIEIG